MPFNPTKSQSDAIKTRGRALLLSAAAGSGKTATLTRRIIESLTDRDEPADISRMLIVTFTRAAASELRERISSALTQALADDPKNSHLLRQSVLIGSADICTIDSFCLNVVRANFQHLRTGDGSPISPDFRLADEAEITALRHSVMNETIDRWYSEPPVGIDFAAFVDNFTGTRDDDAFVNLMLDFNSFRSALIDPTGFTERVAKEYAISPDEEFFKTECGKRILSYTRETLKFCRPMLEHGCLYLNEIGVGGSKYAQVFAYDLELCRRALELSNSGYGAVRRILSDVDFPSLASLGSKADDHTAVLKEVHAYFRDTIKKLTADFFLLPAELIPEYMEKTAAAINILGSFIKDFDAALAHEKAMRHLCDFDDVKRLAHSLLVMPNGEPSGFALELQSKYDAVCIDEYQDVDPIQDDIFRVVSRPGVRFTVGDIKQSIYSFRGAEPTIFGSLRASMPLLGSPQAQGVDRASIFMSENFRCDKNIIDFVNLVSRATFGRAGGAVAYRPEDDLVFGKGGEGATPVKIRMITAPDPRAKSAAKTAAKLAAERSAENAANEADGAAAGKEDYELLYVVNEISALLRDGKKNDGSAITPADIAVLSRSTSRFPRLADALTAAGIPSSDSAARDFFANPEVLLVLSLLSVTDNPQRDVRLAAALRSPFFGFSMDDLIKIRSDADRAHSLFDALELYNGEESIRKKCAAFLSRLAVLRQAAVELPVDRFVRRIYREFAVLSLELSGKDRTPAQIRSNLLRLYEYARSYSANFGGGLSGFVAYLDGIIDANVETANGETGENTVSILSIHKSKGLEFPVVFLIGADSSITPKDIEKSMIYDSRAGIAMELANDSGLARINTPMRSSLARAVRDRAAEEEMRILYVALTRARERLYITGKATASEDSKARLQTFMHDYACRRSVLSAASYFDWLRPVVSVYKAAADIEIISAESLISASDAKIAAADVGEAADDSGIADFFSERFAYTYPYVSGGLPAKLSVSRLYPGVLDDDGAAVLQPDSPPPTDGKPLFLAKAADGEEKAAATAAERGTATHLFLQFCDFASVMKIGVEGELKRLTEQRFIPDSVGASVNIFQLERFFSSDFFGELTAAKTLYREQRFNILLPASHFTEDAALAESLKDESILVQGVIDLFFIDSDGKITLCDYKTDYLTRAEISNPDLAAKKLLARHGQQLRYYSAAIERLTGRVPDRICIYSLPLGAAIDLI